jgi:hypothetical protein
VPYSKKRDTAARQCAIAAAAKKNYYEQMQINKVNTGYKKTAPGSGCIKIKRGQKDFTHIAANTYNF